MFVVDEQGTLVTQLWAPGTAEVPGSQKRGPQDDKTGLRDIRDRAFGAHHQRSAFGIRTDGVEGEALFVPSMDASRMLGWAKVEDKVFSHNEKALVRKQGR